MCALRTGKAPTQGTRALAIDEAVQSGGLQLKRTTGVDARAGGPRAYSARASWSVR